MFVEREAQRSSMHTRHLNEQLVRVLKTIGYDVGFQRGIGQYLFDRDGARYLDLLSGFGVFAIGRNHPVMRNALKSVLDADMPNLVQMDVSTLAGILSEKLLENVPYMDKVFFANSGAETVEAAIKFARNATGRDGIVYCDHAYHGLTYGALSLTDDTNFRTGFGPLLSGCTTVPFNDLEALEKALSSKQVAGFIVEPIQGKGVNLPTDEFLSGAAALCRKYGTLFIADEIQTGLGRTGKFLAIEHWNVEPDMILLAKALSGGHVPVGALLTRKSIFDKIFNRMDRSLVHGSTFGKNDLAMAAGIATLEIMKHEKLVENAAKRGAELRLALQNMIPEFELLKEVRGKGLMIGVEFGPPKSLRLKASWNILESASKGLFCQLITVPLFKEQKILTQVSGHGSHTIKLLPPLVVTEDDGKWIENSFRTVIADSHKVPGAIWSLGKTLVDNAVRKSA
ncbi:ornithine--oxo-acid transaminase [Tardiphaga robiniae]|jgi:ornithine--oxo-acid transaminase|nr:ornithine--oxo-acid transaminase [Tardiphaga robiniae]